MNIIKKILSAWFIVLFLSMPVYASTIYEVLQFRKGTLAEWTTANPIPSSGEPCYETDTRKFKIGDGTTHYLSLPYYTSSSSGSMVYPGSGVGNSMGSAWGTSYTVGVAANNLVQLNSSAKLPAVDGSLLTNLPSTTLRGATKIVAASDSIDHSHADYYTDGTADQTEINTALAVACPGTTGGRVLLLDGTFSLTGQIIIPSNCTLEGQGDGTIIKVAANSGFTWGSVIVNSSQSGGNSNITLANFYYDGNATNLVGGIGGIGDGTNKATAIDLRHVTHLNIHHLTIRNNTGFGIGLFVCSNAEVSDVDIISNNNINADGFDFIGSHDCTLTNSRIEAHGDDTLAIGAVATSGQTGDCYNLTLSNLIIVGGATKGGFNVYVDGSSTNAPYNISLNNAIISAGAFSINLNGLSTSSVKDISLSNITMVNGGSNENAAVYLIYCTRITGTNLKIINPAKHGVLMSYCTDSIIDASAITGVGQSTIDTPAYVGVILRDSSSHNTISNNKFRLSGSKIPTNAINIGTGCNYNIIHGNDLYNSGATDLFDGGTGTMKRDNVNLAGTGWITDAP